MTIATMNSETVLLGDGIAGRIADGDGETVLWVHGYTLDSSIWSELWSLLPDWDHIGIDLPGHGASDPLAPGGDLSSMARRIGRLALDLDVRHLVGLSFGGMIALQVAIEYPDAFSTLILGAPALGGGPQDRHAGGRNLELMKTYRERGPGPWLRELWMQSPPDIFKGAEAHPRLWERLSAVVARHSWRELGDATMQRMSNYPQTGSDMARIGAATLVFSGDDDMAAFKRSAEMIRRSIPRCEREYVPAAGHLCLLEVPAIVAPRIDAHLRAHTLSSERELD